MVMCVILARVSPPMPVHMPWGNWKPVKNTWTRVESQRGPALVSGPFVHKRRAKLAQQNMRPRRAKGALASLKRRWQVKLQLYRNCRDGLEFVFEDTPALRVALSHELAVLPAWGFKV